MAMDRMTEVGLGIDVGGTGVKAALVELVGGELLTSRVKLLTPDPATPEAVAATIREVVDLVGAEHALPADVPVGCGLPGPIKGGKLMLAANLDRGWVGVAADQLVAEALGRRVHVINDADAAGVAEMTIGAGRGEMGTVLLLTLGTGIGSALFHGGRLVPNTEFGHVQFTGRDAETLVGGAARKRRHLGWPAWAREFNEYLELLEKYLWPDLIILGGGVSKSMDKYAEMLKSRAPIVAAKFLNIAGIIGAAMAAAEADAGDAQQLPEDGASDSMTAVVVQAE
jgi:polyphosphate glucokinase